MGTPFPSSMAFLIACPKCDYKSGDDYKQCGGSCPMDGSPHLDPELAKRYADKDPKPFEREVDHNCPACGIRKLVWVGHWTWGPLGGGVKCSCGYAISVLGLLSDERAAWDGIKNERLEKPEVEARKKKFPKLAAMRNRIVQDYRYWQEHPLEELNFWIYYGYEQEEAEAAEAALSGRLRLRKPIF